ncbi:YadA-like family protein [Salmonella enterica subsp. diarizonae serovar 21:z10:e,n,x,z15]|nr:YadA-like family protein [Salmonella enterica subsp. diarizonae]
MEEKNKITLVVLCITNVLLIAHTNAAETSISCYVDNVKKTFRCGNDTITNGKNTIAVGNQSSASGARSIAIGSIDDAINNLDPAFTNNTKSAGDDSISIGAGTTVVANAPGGIAIGSRRHESNGKSAGNEVNSGARVYSINGIAIGTGSVSGSSVVGKQYHRTIAIGDGAKVSGNLNTGLGAGIVVGDSSDSSVAVGFASAIGRQKSGSRIFDNAAKATAVGAGAEVMRGSDRSTSIGSEARVLQGTTQSIALGNNTTINIGGNNSTAVGSFASVGPNAANAIALGGGNDGNDAAKANAVAAIAVGHASSASGTNALALGSYSHADAEGAVIIGSGAKNTKGTLTAVGLPADNGINAIGIGSSAKSAANGIAIGRGAEAKISEARSIALGDGAVSAGGIAFGQGASVVKGNNPSGTASASVAIGRQTTVADYGVALGSRASVGMTLTADGTPEKLTTGGLYGTAVGINSGVYSNSALAVGHNAKVSENANAALAVGYNSQSSAQNAIAIGNSAKATAVNTISIGTGNMVSGNNSGAIGDPSTVSGANSYSLGNNNTVSASNAFVLGSAVNNSVDNSVVLGNGSTVSIAVATPEYTVNGVSHTFSGSAPVSTVSIGDSGKERTLTNVAAGRISATSTDAINGSQLFAVTSEVEKGNQFAGNTGTFNRRLGETTTIRGGLAADAAASNKNIRTVAKDGQIDILLADNLDVTSVKTGGTLLNNDGLHITGGPSVTAGGINAGNRVISNVGDAISDTDAVNKRQLDNLSTIVGLGLTFSANEGNDITRKPGDILALKGDATTKGDYSGKNIKTVTDISTGMISIQIAESPVFGSVVINNNGKITGVSDGAIAAGSKEVVNGGQIHRFTTSVGNIIGGNAHADPDGSLVASNIGNTGKNTIHDAIDSVRSTAETASAGWNLSVNGQQSSAVKPKETVDLNNTDGNISITKKDNQVSFNLSDSVKVKESIGIENGPSLTRTGIDGAGMKITNVADGVIAAGSKDAVNGGQIHDFVSGEVTRPITFAADSGIPYDARLGTTVNVKGDDKNIRTTVSGNTLSVSMNENINVKSITATESLSVASGASVDMGGNAIHNVGNATRPGDAVNYGQFQQAFSSLGNQINRVERRANAGAAAAIATAGLTQAYIPGKSMMSMSGGTFQGESSLAIGLSTISDNGNWVLKGSFSSTTRNQTGASVGVGFQF